MVRESGRGIYGKSRLPLVYQSRLLSYRLEGYVAIPLG